LAGELAALLAVDVLGDDLRVDLAASVRLEGKIYRVDSTFGS
jgi:hypothetical protein